MRMGKQLTYLNERDSDGDGTLDYISSSTRTYDTQGKQLTYISKTDNDADGIN